jgi:uncharacterized protein
MAAGLPDLVDCARLAEDAAVLGRVYSLSDLPRVQDLLAKPVGQLHASFEFAKAASGRAGASITVRAEPQLVCQRCLQGFAFPVSGASKLEFTQDAEATASDTERELFPVKSGMVSLRELAEEELLLALPLAAACSAPQSCGNALPSAASAEAPEAPRDMRRPFSGLQDLLKKT